MAKTFYTERDIQDMANQGVTSLVVNDDIVLTDLGREMAMKRGIRLVRESPPHPQNTGNAELVRRVKAAVIARLDQDIDMNLLDAVITRVVNGLK
ncbi:MAG: hypothetical protein PHQ40_21115 [Anaerolineaceae bacterium]|nr:hypothetical protein [Anaerolineaceae bacterium]